MKKIILFLCLSTLLFGFSFPSFSIGNKSVERVQLDYIARDCKSDIVIDDKNRLMWQDSVDVATNKKTFDEAIEYCRNLDFAGYDNWWVPTKKELLSISNPGQRELTLIAGFKNFQPAYYWSSTMRGDSNSAWYVDFAIGRSSVYLKSKKYYVRCVRSME